jgi:transglutaminase-like putative cysteine protease
MLRAAELAGYPLEAIEDVDESGQRYTRVTVDTHDNKGAIRLLTILAELYASDPSILRLGAYIREQAHAWATLSSRPLNEQIARSVQRYVRNHVRFLEEEDETFRSPMTTIALGEGDCDEHATLVACLGMAAGLSMRLQAMRDGAGEISHVVALVEPEPGRGWFYLETTVDAQFGEEPYAAARRLQLVRPDLGIGLMGDGG